MNIKYNDKWSKGCSKQGNLTNSFPTTGSTNTEVHSNWFLSDIVKIKTKKCQPAARDMPDLIQTEHVPSKGLARPKNKNKLNEKNKNTNKTNHSKGKKNVVKQRCL